MRRSLKKSKRKSESSKRTVGLIAGAIGTAIIAVGAFAYIDALESHVPLNNETLCPLRGPTGVVAILLDTTDALTPIQQRDIANNLNALRHELPTGYLLVGYSITLDESAVVAPAFYLCNPGRGDEVSEFSGNPQLAEDRWLERFEQPVTAALEAMVSSEGANTSPILEAVQAVSVTQFQDPAHQDVPKRLIIISDMLQNSASYSVYGGLRQFADFQSTAEWVRVRTNLKGVPVEILYVMRPEYSDLQTPALLQFWENIFAAEETQIDRVVKIFGG